MNAYENDRPLSLDFSKKFDRTKSKSVEQPVLKRKPENSTAYDKSKITKSKNMPESSVYPTGYTEEKFGNMEEQCLRVLYRAALNHKLTDIRQYLDDNVECIIYNYSKNKAQTVSGKDAVILQLQELCTTREDSDDNGGFVKSLNLGKIEKTYGESSYYTAPVGKHIILYIFYAKPYSWVKAVSLKMTPARKIEKIILEETVSHYSIRLEEEKHYEPNEYIYLNLLKEAIDSNDLSGLVNYLAYDVENEYDGTDGLAHAKGWTNSIKIFNNWLENVRIRKTETVTFLGKVCEGPDKGKIGVCIASAPAFNYAWAVYFIEIKNGAKISSLKFFLAKKYVFDVVPHSAEICKHHKEIPVNKKTEYSDETCTREDGFKKYNWLEKLNKHAPQDAFMYLEGIIFALNSDLCLCYNDNVLFVKELVETVYLEDVIYSLDPAFEYGYSEIDISYIDHLEDIIHELDSEFEIIYPPDIGTATQIVYLEGIITHLNHGVKKNIDYPDGANGIRIMYLEDVIGDLDPDLEINYPDGSYEVRIAYLEGIIHGLDPDFCVECFLGKYTGYEKDNIAKYKNKYSYDDIKIAYLRYIVQKLDPTFGIYHMDDTECRFEGVVAFLLHIIFGLKPDYNLEWNDEAIRKAQQRKDAAIEVMADYHLLKIKANIKFLTKKYLTETIRAGEFYQPQKYKAVITYNFYTEKLYMGSIDFKTEIYQGYFKGIDPAEMVICSYDGKSHWSKEDALVKSIRNSFIDSKVFAKLKKRIGKYKKELRLNRETEIGKT